MTIKKCNKCNGDDFFIQEIIFHEAAISSEDKELTVYKEQTNGIERIFCKNCSAEYLERDFKKVNFR